MDDRLKALDKQYHETMGEIRSLMRAHPEAYRSSDEWKDLMDRIETLREIANRHGWILPATTNPRRS